MAQTGRFKELVQIRAVASAAFRVVVLQEAAETLLRIDVQIGEAILRDYIKAAIGFEILGAATGTQPITLI